MDEERILREEEKVKERTDSRGRWRKVYFGSGDHFRNWLSQIKEIYGDDEVEVEEVDIGLPCFEDGKAYRIWVRVRELP